MNTTTLSPAAPEGFIQQPDALQPEILSDFFDGPTFDGDDWKITTHWDAENGLKFYVDGISGNAISAVEAGKISSALAEVARLASA